MCWLCSCAQQDLATPRVRLVAHALCPGRSCPLLFYSAGYMEEEKQGKQMVTSLGSKQKNTHEGQEKPSVG